jgi:hypothetical protein
MTPTANVIMTKREFVQTTIAAAVGRLFLMADVNPRTIPTREREMIEKRVEQLSYVVSQQLKHLPRMKA